MLLNYLGFKPFVPIDNIERVRNNAGSLVPYPTNEIGKSVAFFLTENYIIVVSYPFDALGF